MNTVLVDKKDIDNIVISLHNNHVVAFPTETVFGLGVVFNSKEALQSLFELKQRDKNKAVTLMLSDIKDIQQYATVGNLAKKVISAYMPGKITVVLNKKDNVDDYFTAGKKTIGIRIPDDDFVLELLRKAGPLLVTSANMSGEESLLKAKDVYQVFDKKLPLIVNDDAKGSKASTVVDLSSEEVVVLRQGDITKEMIEGVVK